jgi:hypothetical protein
MLIVTTIYCTEMTREQLIAHQREQEAALEASAPESAEVSREFLGIYQGTNRVLPMDWNG